MPSVYSQVVQNFRKVGLCFQTERLPLGTLCITEPMYSIMLSLNFDRKIEWLNVCTHFCLLSLHKNNNTSDKRAEHNQFEVYFWLLFCHENYKFQMIWDRLLSKKKLCETFPVGKGNVTRMCLCQGLRTINAIKKTPECPTNASRMCGRNVYTRKREWEREWNELRSLSCECSSFSVCKYLLMPLSFVCSTALVW